MTEKSNLFFELKNYVEYTLKKYNELFEVINTENYSTSIKLDLKQNISHIESILSSASKNPYQVSGFFSNVAVVIGNTISAFSKFKKSNNVIQVLNELQTISEKIISLTADSNLSDEEIANQFNEFIGTETNNKKQNKTGKLNLEKDDLNASYKLLEKTIDEQKIKVDSLISSSLEQLAGAKSQLDEFKNYLDKETPLIKEKLQTSNNFFANVGGAKLAEHYHLQSKKEKNLADNFRLAFIASFAIIFLFLIISSVYFYWNYSNELQWNWLLIKLITFLPILLFFSAGATYLIKESNKHRSRENSLSDKYLALSTIDLYLSTLEKQDQVLIKTKLSEYFFSNQSENKFHQDGFAIDAQETINRLIDAASRKK